MRVNEALLIGPDDREARSTLNRAIGRLGQRGQRSPNFQPLSVAAAGGPTAFGSVVYAATFDRVEAQDIATAVAQAPWRYPEWVRLVIPRAGSWTVEELRDALVA